MMASEDELSLFEEEIALVMNDTTLECNKVLRKMFFRPNNTFVYIHVGSKPDFIRKPEISAFRRIMLCSCSRRLKAAVTGSLTRRKS